MVRLVADEFFQHDFQSENLTIQQQKNSDWMKVGSFQPRTEIYHLNTWLVQYSDGFCANFQQKLPFLNCSILDSAIYVLLKNILIENILHLHFELFKIYIQWGSGILGNPNFLVVSFLLLVPNIQNPEHFSLAQFLSDHFLVHIKQSWLNQTIQNPDKGRPFEIRT